MKQQDKQLAESQDKESKESQDKESGSKRHPDDAATVESQEVFQMEKQEKEKEKQVEKLEEKVDAQATESVAVQEPSAKYENNTSSQNITKGDFEAENDNLKMDLKRMEFDDSIQRKNSVKQKKQSRQQSEIPDSEEVLPQLDGVVDKL